MRQPEEGQARAETERDGGRVIEKMRQEEKKGQQLPMMRMQQLVTATARVTVRRRVKGQQDQRQGATVLPVVSACWRV